MAFGPWGLVANSVGNGASASTYSCDHQWVNNSQLDMARFGGNCNGGLYCGAFACRLGTTVGYHNWYIVAQPSYLPLKTPDIPSLVE